MKTWPDLTEQLIKKHIEKSRNTTMGHMQTIRQGLKYTKEKPPNKEPNDRKSRQDNKKKVS